MNRLTAVFLIIFCLVLSACSGNSENGGMTGAENGGMTDAGNAGAQTGTESAGKTDSENGTGAAGPVNNGTGGISEYRVPSDFEDPDLSDSVKIKFTENGAEITGAGASEKDGTVTITAAGSYVLSGNSSSGRIVVNVNEEGKVKLYLNNLTLSSVKDSAVCVESAAKVTLASLSGTVNTISDSDNYTDTEDGEDACIFSKAELNLDGAGELNIYGNRKSAVHVKAKTQIKGGSINIVSKKHGISSKKTIEIKGGYININAGGDGIKSKKSVDFSEGALYISESKEGIEAPCVKISGGFIDLTSDDDGINASADEDSDSTENTGNKGGFGGFGGIGDFGTQESAVIEISGGTVHINAEGDGIDSNGYIYMSGGTVIIDGPSKGGNGALDYGISMTLTGGTLCAAGAAGMAENVSEAENQVSAYIDVSMNKGDILTVEDIDGNVIISYTAGKKAECAVISHSLLQVNKEYKFFINGIEAGSFIPDSNVYGNSGNAGFPGGFNGPGRHGNSEGFGGPGRPENPDGFGGPERPGDPENFRKDENP